MSALGQKRTYAVQKGMSALPPIADMCGALGDVRLVPIADIASLIRSPHRRAAGEVMAPRDLTPRLRISGGSRALGRWRAQARLQRRQSGLSSIVRP